MDKQRPGQLAFNEVHEEYPEIAEQLRGSEFDPFYHDDRIESFYAQVALLLRRRIS